MTRSNLSCAAIAAVLASGVFLLAVADDKPSAKKPAAEKPASDKADPALARARKQTQMLDDLYKTAIVLVTKTYVETESDVAAATAFKDLFGTMRKKGYHEARLIDATGEPYEPDNAPADDFEKAAISAIKAGKPSYEKEVEKDGKRFLRTVTAVPVVMKKCTLCHPGWEDVKPGVAIGGIGYVVPIE